MRHRLATLIWATALGGCSLIYNPSNLPDKDKLPIDAPIADADPTMLRLDSVKSEPLLEGAGQDGSAPQILVVFGEHITKEAQVEVLGSSEIVTSNLTIADDGNSFALLVKAPYLDMLDEGATIPLMIRVTQPGAEQVTPWELRALDQITTSPQPAPAPGKVFSRVSVADLVFEHGPTKAIVKVVGGITVGGTITANASGQMAGAGGCNGGNNNTPGGCFGGGENGGGGAGFAQPGAQSTALGNPKGGVVVGDELVLVYGDGSDVTMNRSAGGGGANTAGGGGGGTLELTAGGDINVGMLQATGGNSANAGLNLASGGGGAGGVIVMRAGGTLTFPSVLSVSGGVSGTGTFRGGAGSIGRWRYDAAGTSGTVPATNPTATPAPRRGPMIVRPANSIFEQNDPTVMVAGEAGVEVTLITIRPDGLPSESKTQMTIGEMTPLEVPRLAIGLNKVCVIVPGGNITNDEATNCVELAFIP